MGVYVTRSPNLCYYASAQHTCQICGYFLNHMSKSNLISVSFRNTTKFNCVECYNGNVTHSKLQLQTNYSTKSMKTIMHLPSIQTLNRIVSLLQIKHLKVMDFNTKEIKVMFITPIQNNLVNNRFYHGFNTYLNCIAYTYLQKFKINSMWIRLNTFKYIFYNIL